jgi:TonB-linked SusC/RagA family outer membrane protein
MPKKLNLLARNALLVLVFSLFSLALSAQNRTVSGRVTNKTSGQPIAGATVQVKGATTTALTNAEGVFNISAGNNSTLVVTVVGFQQMELPVGTSTAVDFTMTETANQLNEIVVTGYTAQRRKDIIGSVSVVDVNDLKQTPVSNMAVQLQGRAPGVVVSSGGEPGAGAVVRIRGYASGGNNNPLYIVDGVPTTEANQFNPNDIESMQVLKDGAAMSIYGSRASNGVIIVTTKQGRAGRLNFGYDGYVGTSIVTDKMMPDLLNTTQYLDYLQKTTGSTYTHPVFGANGSFKMPDFYITSGGFKGGVAATDPRANPSLYSLNPLYQISKTSAGTDWFDEMTRPAMIQSHQISANGGTDKSTYSMGFNYFNQEGSFVHTYYKRYTLRVNTSFKPVSFLRIGENLQVMYEDRLGGANRGEGDAWASAYRMVPYIPVYDIAGGFGGNGVGESGNGSNPVANLARAKDNTNKFTRVFGNVYAEVPIASWLVAKTSFGIEGGQQFTKSITRKTYERSENVGTTQLTEDGWSFLNWTWTNTLAFDKTFKEDHNVKAMIGSEAIKGSSRGVRAFAQNFDFETADFVSLNTAVAGSLSDRTVSNFNLGKNSLYSLFGRLDYAYKGKYLATGTYRRDGNSRFGADVRYANFASYGLAWRISEENFMKSVSWITDLKLRFGWGELGSDANIPGLNPFDTYVSSAPRTNYDIAGNNTSSAQGYRQGTQGNPGTKWETLETTNFGLDATLFNGKLDLTFEVYTKDTRDLLVPAVRNGLEPQITKPWVNIGTMRNTGFDLGINYKGTINADWSYDLGLSVAAYKNKLTKLNNEGTPDVRNLERLTGVIRSDIGQPVSSFYGFVLDGFFNSAADISALTQDGAVVGSWKYKDLNGDKKITDADRTYIGNPHPDFQAGLNMGLNYKALSLTAFFFWNQGNQIFNYTKYYTDMRVFVGGVSTRVLNDSWTAGNTNAKLPLLAPGSANGYTSYTSSTPNTYYVEDGSYMRLKTLQLSYTLPKSLVAKAKMQGVRLYVQAQNLFTITKYQGADPDMNLIQRDPGGARDLAIGVDLGGFPQPQQFLFGASITF